MVNIGSVGYTFDGIGMLMIDGKCVDRKEAISVIGCSSEDFDNLMLATQRELKSPERFFSRMLRWHRFSFSACSRLLRPVKLHKSMSAALLSGGFFFVKKYCVLLQS